MDSPSSSSWIFFLLSEKFFSPCHLHPHARKNEKNIFCLDCSLSLCPHCLHLHPSHRLLQVRRYVYNDVVRLDDMEKLFDCRFVQSYITNNSRVIFLNHRPQTRPIKCSGSFCTSCHRTLQEPYQFCSLACKVRHAVDMERSVSRYIYDYECLPPLDLGCANLEESQLTPSSVLDTEVSSPNTTSSASCTDADGHGHGDAGFRCTATTEKVTRKKRSTRVPVPDSCDGTAPRSVNKRKGLPLRSPLY